MAEIKVDLNFPTTSVDALLVKLEAVISAARELGSKNISVALDSTQLTSAEQKIKEVEAGLNRLTKKGVQVALTVTKDGEDPVTKVAGGNKRQIKLVPVIDEAKLEAFLSKERQIKVKIVPDGKDVTAFSREASSVTRANYGRLTSRSRMSESGRGEGRISVDVEGLNSVAQNIKKEFIEAGKVVADEIRKSLQVGGKQIGEEAKSTMAGASPSGGITSTGSRRGAAAGAVGFDLGTDAPKREKPYSGKLPSTPKPSFGGEEVVDKSASAIGNIYSHTRNAIFQAQLASWSGMFLTQNPMSMGVMSAARAGAGQIKDTISVTDDMERMRLQMFGATRSKPATDNLMKIAREIELNSVGTFKDIFGIMSSLVLQPALKPVLAGTDTKGIKRLVQTTQMLGILNPFGMEGANFIMQGMMSGELSSVARRLNVAPSLIFSTAGVSRSRYQAADALERTEILSKYTRKVMGEDTLEDFNKTYKNTMENTQGYVEVFKNNVGKQSVSENAKPFYTNLTESYIGMNKVLQDLQARPVGSSGKSASDLGAEGVGSVLSQMVSTGRRTVSTIFDNMGGVGTIHNVASGVHDWVKRNASDTSDAGNKIFTKESTEKLQGFASSMRDFRSNPMEAWDKAFEALKLPPDIKNFGKALFDAVAEGMKTLLNQMGFWGVQAATAFGKAVISGFGSLAAGATGGMTQMLGPLGAPIIPMLMAKGLGGAFGTKDLFMSHGSKEGSWNQYKNPEVGSSLNTTALNTLGVTGGLGGRPPASTLGVERTIANGVAAGSARGGSFFGGAGLGGFNLLQRGVGFGAMSTLLLANKYGANAATLGAGVGAGLLSTLLPQAMAQYNGGMGAIGGRMRQEDSIGSDRTRNFMFSTMPMNALMGVMGGLGPGGSLKTAMNYMFASSLMTGGQSGVETFRGSLGLNAAKAQVKPAKEHYTRQFDAFTSSIMGSANYTKDMDPLLEKMSRIDTKEQRARSLEAMNRFNEKNYDKMTSSDQAHFDSARAALSSYNDVESTVERGNILHGTATLRKSGIGRLGASATRGLDAMLFGGMATQLGDFGEGTLTSIKANEEKRKVELEKRIKHNTEFARRINPVQTAGEIARISSLEIDRDFPIGDFREETPASIKATEEKRKVELEKRIKHNTELAQRTNTVQTAEEIARISSLETDLAFPKSTPISKIGAKAAKFGSFAMKGLAWGLVIGEVVQAFSAINDMIKNQRQESEDKEVSEDVISKIKLPELGKALPTVPSSIETFQKAFKRTNLYGVYQEEEERSTQLEPVTKSIQATMKKMQDGRLPDAIARVYNDMPEMLGSTFTDMTKKIGKYNAMADSYIDVFNDQTSKTSKFAGGMEANNALLEKKINYVDSRRFSGRAKDGSSTAGDDAQFDNRVAAVRLAYTGYQEAMASTDGSSEDRAKNVAAALDNWKKASSELANGKYSKEADPVMESLSKMITDVNSNIKTESIRNVLEGKNINANAFTESVKAVNSQYEEVYGKAFVDSVLKSNLEDAAYGEVPIQLVTKNFEGLMKQRQNEREKDLKPKLELGDINASSVLAESITKNADHLSQAGVKPEEYSEEIEKATNVNTPIKERTAIFSKFRKRIKIAMEKIEDDLTNTTKSIENEDKIVSNKDASDSERSEASKSKNKLGKRQIQLKATLDAMGQLDKDTEDADTMSKGSANVDKIGRKEDIAIQIAFDSMLTNMVSNFSKNLPNMILAGASSEAVYGQMNQSEAFLKKRQAELLGKDNLSIEEANDLTSINQGLKSLQSAKELSPFQAAFSEVHRGEQAYSATYSLEDKLTSDDKKIAGMLKDVSPGYGYKINIEDAQAKVARLDEVKQKFGISTELKGQDLIGAIKNKGDLKATSEIYTAMQQAEEALITVRDLKGVYEIDSDKRAIGGVMLSMKDDMVVKEKEKMLAKGLVPHSDDVLAANVDQAAYLGDKGVLNTIRDILKAKESGSDQKKAEENTKKVEASLSTNEAKLAQLEKDKDQAVKSGDKKAEEIASSSIEDIKDKIIKDKKALGKELTYDETERFQKSHSDTVMDAVPENISQRHLYKRLEQLKAQRAGIPLADTKKRKENEEDMDDVRANIEGQENRPYTNTEGKKFKFASKEAREKYFSVINDEKMGGNDLIAKDKILTELASGDIDPKEAEMKLKKLNNRRDGFNGQETFLLQGIHRGKIEYKEPSKEDEDMNAYFENRSKSREAAVYAYQKLKGLKDRPILKMGMLKEVEKMLDPATPEELAAADARAEANNEPKPSDVLNIIDVGTGTPEEKSVRDRNKKMLDSFVKEPSARRAYNNLNKGAFSQFIEHLGNDALTGQEAENYLSVMQDPKNADLAAKVRGGVQVTSPDGATPAAPAASETTNESTPNASTAIEKAKKDLVTLKNDRNTAGEAAASPDLPEIVRSQQKSRAETLDTQIAKKVADIAELEKPKTAEPTTGVVDSTTGAVVSASKAPKTEPAGQDTTSWLGDKGVLNNIRDLLSKSKGGGSDAGAAGSKGGGSEAGVTDSTAGVAGSTGGTGSASQGTQSGRTKATEKPQAELENLQRRATSIFDKETALVAAGVTPDAALEKEKKAIAEKIEAKKAEIAKLATPEAVKDTKATEKPQAEIEANKAEAVKELKVKSDSALGYTAPKDKDKKQVKEVAVSKDVEGHTVDLKDLPMYQEEMAKGKAEKLGELPINAVVADMGNGEIVTAPVSMEQSSAVNLTKGEKFVAGAKKELTPEEQKAHAKLNADNFATVWKNKITGEIYQGKKGETPYTDPAMWRATDKEKQNWVPAGVVGGDEADNKDLNAAFQGIVESMRLSPEHKRAYDAVKAGKGNETYVGSSRGLRLGWTDKSKKVLGIGNSFSEGEIQPFTNKEALEWFNERVKATEERTDQYEKDRAGEEEISQVAGKRAAEEQKVKSIINTNKMPIRREGVGNPNVNEGRGMLTFNGEGEWAAKKLMDGSTLGSDVETVLKAVNSKDGYSGGAYFQKANKAYMLDSLKGATSVDEFNKNVAFDKELSGISPKDLEATLGLTLTNTADEFKKVKEKGGRPVMKTADRSWRGGTSVLISPEDRNYAMRRKAASEGFQEGDPTRSDYTFRDIGEAKSYKEYVENTRLSNKILAMNDQEGGAQKILDTYGLTRTTTKEEYNKAEKEGKFPVHISGKENEEKTAFMSPSSRRHAKQQESFNKMEEALTLPPPTYTFQTPDGKGGFNKAVSTDPRFKDVAFTNAPSATGDILPSGPFDQNGISLPPPAAVLEQSPIFGSQGAFGYNPYSKVTPISGPPQMSVDPSLQLPTFLQAPPLGSATAAFTPNPQSQKHSWADTLGFEIPSFDDASKKEIDPFEIAPEYQVFPKALDTSVTDVTALEPPNQTMISEGSSTSEGFGQMCSLLDKLVNETQTQTSYVKDSANSSQEVVKQAFLTANAPITR